MKKIFFLLLFALIGSNVLAAPSAFVTIAPQKYFVDKISGGLAHVSVMVQPGDNPHAYEPKPRQMVELAKAQLYFAIGDTFDAVWLKRIIGTNPDITIVHTETGIEKLPSEDPDEAVPATPDGQDHGILDPHIWLDPALVKIQARNIRDGLSRIDPEHTSQYIANTEAFEQELDALDAEIKTILAPVPADKRTFLVFHPSWAYFAKAYGLTQVSIEVEGKEPSPREMAQIIDLGKQSKTKVIFVQPQFSEKSASVIARQIGAKVVRLDPLSPDWADNMRQAAHAISDALR